MSFSKDRGTGDHPGRSQLPDANYLLAVHEFIARSEDEVSLRKGDRVEVIETDRGFDDGWFIGKNMRTRKTGLFPRMFTTELLVNKNGGGEFVSPTSAVAGSYDALTQSHNQQPHRQAPHQNTAQQNHFNFSQPQQRLNSQNKQRNSSSSTASSSIQSSHSHHKGSVSPIGTTTGTAAAAAQVASGATSNPRNTISSGSNPRPSTKQTSNSSTLTSVDPSSSHNMYSTTTTASSESSVRRASSGNVHSEDYRRRGSAHHQRKGSGVNTMDETINDIDAAISSFKQSRMDSDLQPSAVGEVTTKLAPSSSPVPTIERILDWTPLEVQAYLRSKGYDEDVTVKFVEHKITGPILLELDLAYLKEIEISSFGTRFELSKDIKYLKERAFRANSTSSSSSGNPPQTRAMSYGSGRDAATNSHSTPLASKTGSNLQYTPRSSSLRHSRYSVEDLFDKDRLASSADRRGSKQRMARSSTASRRSEVIQQQQQQFSSANEELNARSEGTSAAAAAAAAYFSNAKNNNIPEYFNGTPTLDSPFNESGSSLTSGQPQPHDQESGVKSYVEEARNRRQQQPYMGTDQGDARFTAYGEPTHNHARLAPRGHHSRDNSVDSAFRLRMDPEKTSQTHRRHSSMLSFLGESNSNFGFDNERDPTGELGDSLANFTSESPGASGSNSMAVTDLEGGSGGENVPNTVRAKSRKKSSRDWWPGSSNKRTVTDPGNPAVGGERSFFKSGNSTPKSPDEQGPRTGLASAKTNGGTLSGDIGINGNSTGGRPGMRKTASQHNLKKRPAMTKQKTSAFVEGLQSIAAKEATKNADFSGWMHKKGSGSMATWRNRYFTLHGTRLSYFTNFTDARERGLIDITGHRVLPVRENEDKFVSIYAASVRAGKHCFKLVPPAPGFRKGVMFTAPRVHFFAVESKEEMRNWMAALMKATIDRDDSVPVISSCATPTVPLPKAQEMFAVARARDEEFRNEMMDEGEGHGAEASGHYDEGSDVLQPPMQNLDADMTSEYEEDDDEMLEASNLVHNLNSSNSGPTLISGGSVPLNDGKQSPQSGKSLQSMRSESTAPSLTGGPVAGPDIKGLSSKTAGLRIVTEP